MALHGMDDISSATCYEAMFTAILLYLNMCNLKSFEELAL